MLSNFMNLFISLFNSCLYFDSIIYFLSAICIICMIVSIFSYFIKGKY